MPNSCIGIDTIVGFPTETDYDFNQTYDMLNHLDISYLHVFSYSERRNTEAKNIFPKVTPDTITNRRNKLRLLSKYKYNKFIKNNIDNDLNILFEKYDNGLLSGWTDNYIKVLVKGNKNLVNKIKKIKIVNHTTDFTNGIFV